jgi:exodeoxyribonuclease VII large subunit
VENKLSVSQLNNYIKGVFDDETILQNISVYGELYEFKVAGNNTYITLKESDCFLNCVKYSKLERIELGTVLTLFGSVTFYRKSGRVSFEIKSIAKAGEGKYYSDLQKLKEKLYLEGAFSNHPSLPEYISNCAIVTSSTGAVIHDFASVLAEKSGVNVEVFKSSVQGDNAEDELITALLAAEKGGFDVIVVARGGGSSADLDCFNKEKVVRTLSSLKTPTISAIGHEVDYTLCDLAASVRAGTPSIAAKIIVDTNAATIDRFKTALISLSTAIKEKLDSASTTVFLASNKITFEGELADKSGRYKVVSLLYCIAGSVKEKYDDSLGKVMAFSHTISTANRVVERAEAKFSLAAGILAEKNPLKIFASGYSIVQKDGQKLTSAKQIKEGDEVKVFLKDGSFSAKVEEVKI